MNKEKIEFRAEREALGLSQLNVAAALAVDVRTVKRWEAPGGQMPPEYAWNILSEYRRRHDWAVAQAEETALEASERFDGRPGAVALPYYRSEDEFLSSKPADEGPYGAANSIARDIRARLERLGFECNYIGPEMD